MQSPAFFPRDADAVLAVDLLFIGSACTQNNNAGPNKPANATHGTGQALPHSPSAGAGPRNAGPAGSQ